jgi:hypothetical protein
MLNFYKHIPKELKKNNTTIDKKTHMTLPFRGLVIGYTGSGKTCLALSILKEHSKLYTRVVVITRNADEDLYNYLKSKLPPENLEIIEIRDDKADLSKIGPPEDYKSDDDKHYTLMIFDDLMLLKNQKPIEEIFNRGRKMNICSLYLTQSYFKTPRTIRLNSNYIFLKKIQNTRDITHIINEYSINIDKKRLIQIYRDCTGTFENFLTIDVGEKPEKMFRSNFDNILDV